MYQIVLSERLDHAHCLTWFPCHDMLVCLPLHEHFLSDLQDFAFLVQCSPILCMETLRADVQVQKKDQATLGRDAIQFSFLIGH